MTILKRSTSDDFTAANRALNDSLEMAGETIAGLKIGMSGEVELTGGHSLVYGHRDKKTRKRQLYFDRVGEAGGHVELKHLSIDERLEVAEALPRLVDVLRATRADRGVEIQTTADKLDAYLEKLGD